MLCVENTIFIVPKSWLWFATIKRDIEITNRMLQYFSAEDKVIHSATLNILTNVNFENKLILRKII